VAIKFFKNRAASDEIQAALELVAAHAVLMVLVVAGVFALLSVRISQGERLPLPSPLTDVVVHGDAK
jgi:hypothetical protein